MLVTVLFAFHVFYYADQRLLQCAAGPCFVSMCERLHLYNTRLLKSITAFSFQYLYFSKGGRCHS